MLLWTWFGKVIRQKEVIDRGRPSYITHNEGRRVLLCRISGFGEGRQ
jgi:hypothetical protein